MATFGPLVKALASPATPVKDSSGGTGKSTFTRESFISSNDSVTVELNVQAQEAFGDHLKACNSCQKRLDDYRKEKGYSGESSSLDSKEIEFLSKLKAKDQAVKSHEAAHMTSATGVASGGSSFVYQIGPDGNKYAIGGEVGISLSPGATPEATIKKGEQIKKAALAPLSPSSQDRAVAQAAEGMIQEAKAELKEKQEKESKSSSPQNVSHQMASGFYNKNVTDY